MPLRASLSLDSRLVDEDDEATRKRYVENPAAYADGFKLPPDQRAALVAFDMPAFVKMGAHPLVPFLAQMQIERLRRSGGRRGT